jgi:hypothetical protein
MGDDPGGRTMDDTACREFFLQPTQPRHRRYEALRAYFIDHRPLPEIARTFGYRYGTLRNLVTEFRAQCRRDRVGQIARDGGARHDEINRRPGRDEMAQAFDAARRAGLWRFDRRRAA